MYWAEIKKTEQFLGLSHLRELINEDQHCFLERMPFIVMHDKAIFILNKNISVVGRRSTTTMFRIKK